MEAIDPDLIIDSVRQRLRDLPNLARFCRENELAYDSVQKFIRRTVTSPSVHWIANVDRALRKSDGK